MSDLHRLDPSPDGPHLHLHTHSCPPPHYRGGLPRLPLYLYNCMYPCMPPVENNCTEMRLPGSISFLEHGSFWLR